MNDQTTRGIVLKSVDYSETSLIVRIFTEDYGKLTVMSRGARKSKHGIGGLLKPPNQLSITYRHRDNRDIQTLMACEYDARHPGIVQELSRSAAAMLAVEMLDRSVHDYDPHSILFRLIASFLEQLSDLDSEPARLIHFYQLHLSRQLGFAPHLDHCVHCGRPLTTAVVETVAGHLSCTHCRPGGEASLSAEELNYLRSLQSTNIAELGDLNFSASVLEKAGNFLLDHLTTHVDGMERLKSVEFWQTVRS